MDVVALVARIERLESSNRRLRVIAALSPPLLGALVLLMSAAQGPQGQGAQAAWDKDELRVKKLVAERIEAEIVNIDGALSVLGERGITMILPGSVLLTSGTYSVGMKASHEDETAYVGCGGPSAPGSVPKEGPFSQLRVGMNFSGSTGSAVVLRDGLNRVRTMLGAQSFLDGASQRPIQHPENTLTLWSESGKMDAMLPPR